MFYHRCEATLGLNYVLNVFARRFMSLIVLACLFMSLVVFSKTALFHWTVKNSKPMKCFVDV